MDGFLKIAAANDLEPGGSLVVSFLGRKVRIDRDSAGRYTAVDLVCRHQNFDLSNATVERHPDGDLVTCPAHGWRYNLTTGACLNEPWAELRRREVRVDDGQVYLGLQPLASGSPPADGGA